jgi:hypothetical protein
VNEGIFGLSRPDELLNKLEHDFQRLQADDGQQMMLYTAFDFFVTAYSLVDWLQNSGERTKAEVKVLRGQMMTKICADLANGSKHFQLTQKPKTTLTTHAAPPAYSSAFAPRQFQTQWSACIKLRADEAQAAGVPEICPIRELAPKVLAHWRSYFRQPRGEKGGDAIA